MTNKTKAAPRVDGAGAAESEAATSAPEYTTPRVSSQLHIPNLAKPEPKKG